MSIAVDGSTVSQLGLQRLNIALELLGAHAPEELWHLHREIRSVGVDANACGPNAIACTAAYLGRHINLTHAPELHDVVELAVTLSHEGRHHFTDEYGRHAVLPHRCVDCTNEAQRAIDPIYQRDEVVRSKLRVGLGLELSPAQKVGAVVLGGAAAVGIGLALKALFGRR